MIWWCPRFFFLKKTQLPLACVFCTRMIMVNVNISWSHQNVQVYCLDWKLDDTSALNTSLITTTVWKAASRKQGWIIKVAPIKTAEPAWGTAGFVLIPHPPIHPSNRRYATQIFFYHLFFLPPPAVCTARSTLPPALTPLLTPPALQRWLSRSPIGL